MADPLTILGLSYAGKEAVAVVGQFTRDIFGPSARAIGDGMAAPLRAWADRRAKRAEQLVTDAALSVDAAGGIAHPVPGRILFPILERGSVEEDETLRQKWVVLLARASMAPDSIPPMYPAILAELGATDAQILDWVHCAPAGSEGKTLQRAIRETGNDSETMTLSISNLERLRLLVPSTPLLTREHFLEHQLVHLYLSPLGAAFVRAVGTEA